MFVIDVYKIMMFVVYVDVVYVFVNDIIFSDGVLLFFIMFMDVVGNVGMIINLAINFLIGVIASLFLVD